MNNLKRTLGYVWMALGPIAMIFMFWQAMDKIGLANQQVESVTDLVAREAAKSVAVNTILQWSIIILVFMPIACGMVIFGKYAVSGAYDQLPHRSDDLE